MESMSLNSMGWDGALNEDAMNHPVASGTPHSPYSPFPTFSPTLALIMPPRNDSRMYMQAATCLWDRHQRTS